MSGGAGEDKRDELCEGDTDQVTRQRQGQRTAAPQQHSLKKNSTSPPNSPAKDKAAPPNIKPTETVKEERNLLLFALLFALLFISFSWC